ncbi:hypothetical protein [Marasmitruncus massiliensis]|uniref:hypothetical protein n=1 Tax=Marasmitruncus massiliensis TaxID=1944642 RepID=UPI000C7DDCD5|nr:hypothetical protein [Marasmitruncus massiliensis]MBE6905434.1 hypothetical protein [Oscillospiraceae bacterium]
MTKNDLRLFFSAFLLSLLLSGWIAAFLLVDSSSSQYESGDTVPALSLSQPDALHYRVALLGQEYHLSLDSVNQWESWRKEYACLVTPRTLLNGEIAVSLCKYYWIKYYDQYLNDQYLQNIKKTPVS